MTFSSTTGGQALPSSGQRPAALSPSSSASTAKPPVGHDATEKIYTKQMLGPEDKSLGTSTSSFFLLLLTFADIVKVKKNNNFIV